MRENTPHTQDIGEHVEGVFEIQGIELDVGPSWGCETGSVPCW